MGKYTFIYKFFFAPSLRWLRLLLLIAVIFININPFESIVDYQDVIGKEKVATINKNFFYIALLMTVVGTIIVLLNLYVLTPKLLFNKKYFYYLLSIIVVTLLFFIIYRFSFNRSFLFVKDFIPPIYFNIKDIVSFCTTPIIFFGATTGFVIFKKWIYDTEKISELKNLNLQNELAGLKNQVNPHFLFNTLNNLNTLIAIDKVKASQVVLGLSDVLRYQIYDGAKDVVILKKDIATLEQFLLLEKIRRENFNFEIIDNTKDRIEVPPLLFINFVENAAKHSMDNATASFCTITFSQQNETLLFTCVNSKSTVNIHKKVGGVGLANVQRRLELLYQNNYTLSFNDAVNQYAVMLSIPITKTNGNELYNN